MRNRYTKSWSAARSILQTYLRDIFRFGGEVLKFCVKFFDLPQIFLQI